jgi:hypothetical protein
MAVKNTCILSGKNDLISHLFSTLNFFPISAVMCSAVFFFNFAYFYPNFVMLSFQYLYPGL